LHFQNWESKTIKIIGISLFYSNIQLVAVYYTSETAGKECWECKSSKRWKGERD